MSFTPAQLAAFIDHTLLKPDASAAQIEQLCAEAREHGFFAVCVNGAWVAAARHFLDGSDVKVVSVVGFPLGAMAADVKRYETEVAVDDGAHEIDVVLNVARLKAGLLHPKANGFDRRRQLDREMLRFVSFHEVGQNRKLVGLRRTGLGVHQSIDPRQGRLVVGLRSDRGDARHV